MTSKDNIIYYTITAVVFVGIVVCSLLFHNPGQPTNGDSERENTSTIVIAAAAVVTAGAGYASDVEFGGDLSFKTTDQYGREGKVLKDIEPFKTGINYLGAGGIRLIHSYVTKAIYNI